MMIGEFSRRTGLSADTIRFYVRRGLLAPETGAKGGRNPYQMFTQEHVMAARMIRMGQSLGMPLKQIAALNAEYLAGGMTRERSIEIMAAQLAKLEEKAADLETMAGYLRRKLQWLEAGAVGEEPSFPVQGWTGEACEAQASPTPAPRRRSAR
jgi:DNA-binding transcriptional MerR regulator